MGVAESLIQASLIGEAIDGGPVLVFVADETMRYIAVNAYACEVLGYTREELLALKVTEVAREAAATDEYAEMMKTRQKMGTSLLTHKDGHSLSFRYQAREGRVAGMTLYVAAGFVEP